MERKCDNCRFYDDGMCYKADEPVIASLCKDHKYKNFKDRTGIKWGKKNYYSNVGVLERSDDVPEFNKWLAADYIKLIGKYWHHDQSRGGNIDVLAMAVLRVYNSLWRNGDTKNTITEVTPEDVRQNIYWLKTLVAYKYVELLKYNEEKVYREHNTELIPFEHGTWLEDTKSDGVKEINERVEKIFEWLKDNLFEKINYRRFLKNKGKGKIVFALVLAGKGEKRVENCDKLIEIARRHWLDGEKLSELAKKYNTSSKYICIGLQTIKEIIKENKEEIFE